MYITPSLPPALSPSLPPPPLSFVEGAGFRSFMTTVAPHYLRLSQRAVGLQLYEDVERKIKPQLIRDLQARLAGGEDGDRRGAIHVTFDLWAGRSPSPSPSRASSPPSPPSPSPPSSSSSSSTPPTGEEPVVVVAVQLHFVDSGWRLRRSTVAFRQLAGGGRLAAALGRELEEVLLGYGLFPHAVGYVVASRAKEALEANAVFGDYKVCGNGNGRHLYSSRRKWRPLPQTELNL